MLLEGGICTSADPPQHEEVPLPTPDVYRRISGPQLHPGQYSIVQNIKEIMHIHVHTV